MKISQRFCSPFLVVLLVVALISLLACSITTAPEPTSTPAPTVNTPTPIPTATPMPTAVPTMAPTTPSESSTLIRPSVSEMWCLEDQVTMILRDPALATHEEMTAVARCLDDDALLNLFLAKTVGEVGSLSNETMACVRSGFQDIDISALILSSLEDREEADAMTVGMAGILITLSCLNDEEWETASASWDVALDNRENVQCMMAELGGPKGLVALLDSEANSPAVFLIATIKCGISMKFG